MSTYQTTREALLSALKHYSNVLEERKSALGALSHTTDMVREVLACPEFIDMNPVLDRREREIRNYELVSSRVGDELDRLIETARKEAADTSDEIYRAASSLAAMQLEHGSAFENVLTSQQQCESMLRTRLEETANAIKDSRSRRKLDSAYGPALSHNRQPVFLDKQR